MNNEIGPCLPPHLQQEEVDTDDSVKTIGPALPPDTDDSAKSIGPALPPWLSNKKSDSKVIEPSLSVSENFPEADGALEKKDNVEIKEIGPSIPSWLKGNEDSFGPALPPGFTKNDQDRPDSQSSEDADEFIIGPLPPSSNEDNVTSIAEEIEKRSKKMKDKLEGREEPKKLEREEWMTELPPLLQGFGGGPRKFRAREKQEIGDRSVWTETPADKARKAAQGKVPKVISDDERIDKEAWAKRDAEITKKLASESNPDRGESLLEKHDKARKRKLKEDQQSGEANIRRPFDRELDLQTNKFDDAAKKRFIKKTQGLSSRFSSGSTTQKFL